MSGFPNLEALFVSPDAPLRMAMAVFDRHAERSGGSGFALVVNGDRTLLGVVTDGDVRRALLAGLTTEEPVARAMCATPVTAPVAASPHQMLRLFDKRIKHLPLVDSEGRVVDLLLYSAFSAAAPSAGTVVVRGKAPLRVSFAGGGTDFTHHFERGPCAVVSATITQYCHGMLVKRADRRVMIRSEDYGQEVEAESWDRLTYDGKLDLLKAVIRLCRPEHGVELTTWSDAPPGSGLGSSAAMAVVAIGLINELAEDRKNEYQVSDLAYQAERVELGIPGGWQDQYAAAFGGFNFIEFTDREVLVHPLALRDRVVNELEESLLLCFSGQTRDSGGAHEQRRQLTPAQADELRQRSLELATAVRNALVQGRLSEFGRLLDAAWRSKKATGDVTNDHIDALYDAAMQEGAVGGKLLGAGQGGHLLFYSPPHKRGRIARELERMGGRFVPLTFDSRGMRTWRLLGEETHAGPAPGAT